MTDSSSTPTHHSPPVLTPPWKNVRPMNRSRKDVIKVPKVFRVSDNVRNTMQHQINTVGVDGQRFAYEISAQDSAYELVDELSLHIPDFSLRDVVSKFSVVQSYNNDINSKKGSTERYERVTRYYLCACAIDHTAGRAAKSRKIAWDNVGCMSWVKLTTTHESTASRLVAIDEIIGFFEHSPSCRATTQTTIVPRTPLHPELRAFALELCRRHIPLTQVQIECRDYACRRWGNQAGDESYRFRFNAKETTSLYRSLRSEMCISQKTHAEDNLHKWFRAQNPQPPSSALTEALVHYQPQTETERFELILSTPDQQTLAWQYGHKKTVLMDGTFGVCSARILLFILMVIDDGNHGIPIAFILFTAKEEAKAVHASYDRGVLQGLLSHFKAAMGSNGAGEFFEFAVGMTDNDPREHHALRSQWPGIFLMLCLFHISQAWRNALNSHLRVVPKGDPRKQVRRRLGKLLRRWLKEITDYNTAITAYNDEVVHFRSQAESPIELLRKQALGALSFLTYVQDYLKDRTFWCTWSAASAVEAAARLNISISAVPRTTNHLESFNGRLKHKYFQPYMKSGRLPRADVYVLTLVNNVIPTILQERQERADIALYRETLTTGSGLRPAKRIGTSATSATQPAAPSTSTVEVSAARPVCKQAVVSEAQVDLEILESDIEGDNEDEEEKEIEYPSLLPVPINEAPADVTNQLPDEAISICPPSPGWDAASEHALDEVDIIGDLLSDVDIDMPYTLAQEPVESTSDILGDLNREIAEEELAIQNQQMIAWRQLMLSQDESARHLKELLRLGLSNERLQEFMSPSIVSRIRRTPAQVLDIADRPPKRRAEEEANIEAPKRIKFDRQLKEARKESYGFR